MSNLHKTLTGFQLSKLITFEVAARHESFALAAEELFLTPSAVSHQINLLEKELNIKLRLVILLVIYSLLLTSATRLLIIYV